MDLKQPQQMQLGPTQRENLQQTQLYAPTNQINTEPAID